MPTERVCVTMRLAHSLDFDEPRDAISHDWIRLLEGLGLIPWLVPNVISNVAEYLMGSNVTRILLTNGDSLGALEGELGGPAPTKRDQLEFQLLDMAIQKRIPVLGVCRGLQVVNAYFGGGVTRNLKDACGEEHAGSEHELRVRGDSTISSVNSFHNEGVLEHQVAGSLKVLAVSPGGVVEALAHETLPIWAVQWHPERAGAPFQLDGRMFDLWLST